MTDRPYSVAQHLAAVARAAGCAEELRRLLGPPAPPVVRRDDDGDDVEMREYVQQVLLDDQVKKDEAARRAELVRGFLRDCCVEGKKKQVDGRALYDAFLPWAARNRVAQWTVHQFTAALVANGFGRDPAGAQLGYRRIWSGLTLKP
jgi:hypothetical protein